MGLMIYVTADCTANRETFLLLPINDYVMELFHYFHLHVYQHCACSIIIFLSITGEHYAKVRNKIIKNKKQRNLVNILPVEYYKIFYFSLRNISVYGIAHAMNLFPFLSFHNVVNISWMYEIPDGKWALPVFFPAPAMLVSFLLSCDVIIQ
jgi:hypothetical protein